MTMVERLSGAVPATVARWHSYWPGVCVAVTVAMAATFLSLRYGAPAMLMALLLGLVFNFLSETPRVVPGIEFAATRLLRVGVALLGLRITLDDVFAVGWMPVVMVLVAVLCTIVFGTVLARMMGCSRDLGTLTGGAVAICGASAAMAISSVLPQNEQTRKETLFAVIGVTTLSTTAMVLYPVISHALALSDVDTGLFLGGTIHDVAQVVGAGYSVSNEVGDLSTLVKLLRVAMLVPVVIAIGFIQRKALNQNGDQPKGKLPVPGFLFAFVILFALNSAGLLPQWLVQPLAASASWLLLIAIAGLGVRTSLQSIMTVGFRPVLLMIGETVFIASLILGFIVVY